MNRRGFTLIEIIMVIVIMGLLLLFLVPNVFVLINKSGEKSCNSLINNIESAAKIYVINNKYQLGFSCDEPEDITLDTLIKSGDLKTDSSGKIVNPVTNSVIDPNTITVTVIYDCNTKMFSYTVNDITCTK